MNSLIPVKCFTCGTVLADKYPYYMEEVRKKKLLSMGENVDSARLNKVIYLTKDFNKKTIEGEVMDEIGLNKICCRRHLLTKV
jgi:DNA-directed RNA polymerase I, II, and III subunit RPABC5